MSICAFGKHFYFVIELKWRWRSFFKIRKLNLAYLKDPSWEVSVVKISLWPWVLNPSRTSKLFWWIFLKFNRYSNVKRTQINKEAMAVVVAQLVERSLPTPEVRSLNPVIREFLNRTFVYPFQLYWKNENR